MKKLSFFKIIVFATLAYPANLLSQNFEIETQTFDLENVDLHKGYNIYSGYTDKEGNYVIKLGKAACEMSQTSGFNVDGSYGNTYYYHGVSYKFSELKFDKNLKYIGLEEKYFPTTIQTLAYEPVLGKRFWPFLSSTYFKKPLTPDYVGTKILAPEYGLTGAVVKSFIVGGVPMAPWGGKFGTNYYSCSERIELQGESKISPKENKGERWMIADHFPIPNGGVIAWVTDAIKDNTDKANFIVKKYNENLEEVAKVRLMVDYKSGLRIMPIDRKDGKRDFAVFVLAQSTKFAPGKKVVDLTEGTLFILNGHDLSIKSQSPFKMKYSQWYLEEVVMDDDGNLYAMGTTCKTDKENFTAFSLMSNQNNTFKKHPNYQILKADANGNVIYVNAFVPEVDKDKISVIEGINMKIKPQLIFNTYEFLKDIYFTDKYMIIAGQQYNKYVGRKFYSTSHGIMLPDVEKENLFLAIVDKNTGELVKYFIKPEDAYGSYDVVFDKNKKNLYWATYDWKKYNNSLGDVVVTPDKYKGLILGEVYLSKIDLTTLNATPFANLGENKWGVAFNAPMMLNDNANDFLLFQGRTLNKKAKDSELIIAKVKK